MCVARPENPLTPASPAIDAREERDHGLDRCCDLDKITPVDHLQQGAVTECMRKTTKVSGRVR